MICCDGSTTPLLRLVLERLELTGIAFLSQCPTRACVKASSRGSSWQDVATGNVHYGLRTLCTNSIIDIDPTQFAVWSLMFRRERARIAF
jgi:hypothetical protein